MPDPLPENTTLTTWSQGYEAWLQLLDASAHSLWIADHDLSGFHIDRESWTDALLHCMRRLTPGRFHILVRDDTALLTRLPRTRQVLIDFGHVAHVRKISTPHAATLQQAVALGDERHVLLRPQLDVARAFLRWNDPADGARHLPTLQALWETAEPISLGTVLGL